MATSIYETKDIKKLLSDLPTWANDMAGAIEDDITPPFTDSFLAGGQMKYVCDDKIIEIKQLENGKIQVQY